MDRRALHSRAWHSRALHRRAVLAGLAAIAIATAATATGAATLHAQTPGRMVFITPQGLRLAYAPVLVAQAGGHFHAQGIDVQIIGGASSPQAVQQVISGQALVGRTAGATLLSGGGARRHAALDRHHRARLAVLHDQRAAQAGEHPRDLVGGTVGVISQNGPSENTLDAMLLSEGIDPKSVHAAVYRRQSGRLCAARGRAATSLHGRDRHLPPARSRAIGGSSPSTPGKYMPLPGQVYVATDAAIAQQGATLTAFLRGVQRCHRLHPADTAARRDAAAAAAPFPSRAPQRRARRSASSRQTRICGCRAGPSNVLRNMPENGRGASNWRCAPASASRAPDKLYTNALLGPLRGCRPARRAGRPGAASARPSTTGSGGRWP